MKNFLGSLNTFGKGSWLFIPSKLQQPDAFLDNCEKLTSLFRNTPVCLNNIKYTQKYLADSNFFVFVDNNGIPQIVGNTSVGCLEYLRGICDGYEQTIDREYLDVANEFLTNCKNVLYRTDVWKLQTNWYNRLKIYKELFKTKKYDLIDVENLIEDLAYNGYSLHYQNSLTSDKIYYPAIKRELLEEPMLKPMIAQHLGCKTDELYIGKYYGNGKDKKYIIGHLLSDYLHKDCQIKKVFGYLQIKNYRGDFQGLDSIDATLSFSVYGWAGSDVLFENFFKNSKVVKSNKDFEKQELTM